MAANLIYTPLDEINNVHSTAVQAFKSGKLKPISYRKEQLLQLAYLVQDNQDRFNAALNADLGRPTLENNMLELGGSISEILDAYKNVEAWAKPEKAPFNMNFFPMSPTIRKEAKGVLLIISPFNYPVWLCLAPMAGAIAAGNAIVLKPSELTPATSSLLAELFPKYLDNELFHVVNGAIPETTRILELQWDHILYTGSGNVARIVATAAAKHLTPLTLELGGKSPVVIDPKTDFKMAAKRILWGKTVNAGQTCTAPDYILIVKDKQDELVNAFKQVYQEFYPDGAANSKSYSRIIATRHWQRLVNLVKSTKGTIVVGGEHDASTKFLAPTIVRDVKFDDPLMQEEIFGPILPIVPVDDVDSAIAYINAHDHPLGLYTFTKDSAFKAKVFDNTQSGACVANEVVIQPGVHGLPFGGVGASGYGRHTGKFSFDEFTHLRATLDNPAWTDMQLGARFPPYTNKKEAAIQKLLIKTIPYPRPGESTTSWSKWLGITAVLGGAVAVYKKYWAQ